MDDKTRANIAAAAKKVAGYSDSQLEELIASVLMKIVTCKGCRQKNRYRANEKRTPRCGKCGLPL